ncbi:hypothetical protein [Chitinophaga pinensis]|uniref:Uncharacterized protein n=1 Tax=Chitinophaga pinensis (strain ATCC 43595 / DSM 2588 / LMG 13176 / NBRC 15968 / NCIMB 11800 / UQM 2034) TaxID=485918 RepID=A0A979FZ53_CHIPD|nr:hypothetical protein [Chitinophaga pinensis]ACU57805.1 hypothetical protein Cpin_0306 [Chitinophaga pinensis DSM 2588]
MKSTSPPRTNYILHCIISLFFSAPLYAQQYDKAVVNINTSPIDITTLAKIIAKQTGLEYSLNMQNSSLKKRITLRAGNWQLANILKQVQQQANLSYKIIGDHILFMDTRTGDAKRNSLAAEAPKTAPAPSAPNHQNTRPAESATRRNLTETSTENTDALTLHALSAVATTNSDTSVTLNTLAQTQQGPHFRKRGANYKMSVVKKTSRSTTGITSAGTNTKTIIATTTISTKENSTIKPAATTSSNNNDDGRVNWYKPYLKAGLSADEILYGNVSMITGFRYLYGIASYGYTSYGGRFRWGAGIPVKLNETQQLHITFTTGTIKYDVPDSLGIDDIHLKERLNRYSLGWSKTFSEKWSLHAQVHYNDLRKKADHIPPPIFENLGEQRKFRYGKAPYTISERFGTQNDYQRWIGIQLSLYYHFF